MTDTRHNPTNDAGVPPAPPEAREGQGQMQAQIVNCDDCQLCTLLSDEVGACYCRGELVALELDRVCEDFIPIPIIFVKENRHDN